MLYSTEMPMWPSFFSCYLAPTSLITASASANQYTRSLDAAGTLGLLLHHLCSTMNETALQQIFAVVPAVLLHYIHFAMSLLLTVLCTMPDGQIEWPNELQMRCYSAAITWCHPRVHHAFGCFDGLNLLVNASRDVEIENANYNGWLHVHMVRTVIAFVPDGKNKCISTIKMMKLMHIPLKESLLLPGSMHQEVGMMQKLCLKSMRCSWRTHHTDTP